MLIDFGIPLTADAEGDEHVHAAEQPAGFYAIVLDAGHYDALRKATGQLLDWAASGFDLAERRQRRLAGALRTVPERSQPAARSVKVGEHIAFLIAD
jgi:hypothetical protein